MKWITLYSQTGSEISNLSQALRREPDLIISNNIELPLKGSIYCNHKDLEALLVDSIDDDTIITMHGYLRILQPSICDLPCTILNGHPAPIHLYPELKGKDMQEILFTHKWMYPKIGTVIHEVIAELDSGSIIDYNDADNELTSIEDAYQTLKRMSFNLWYKFLSGRL